jgi:hypothetical protein
VHRFALLQEERRLGRLVGFRSPVAQVRPPLCPRFVVRRDRGQHALEVQVQLVQVRAQAAARAAAPPSAAALLAEVSILVYEPFQFLACDDRCLCAGHGSSFRIASQGVALSRQRACR